MVYAKFRVTISEAYSPLTCSVSKDLTKFAELASGQPINVQRNSVSASKAGVGM
jgi:hypothetical protein